MLHQQMDISTELNKRERRLKVLSEHIRQADVHRANKPVYQQYEQLKPKKKGAFYQAHTSEIILFEAAKKYLVNVLNGHPTIPRKSWEDEADRLDAEKKALYQNYHALKNEAQEVEKI